MKDITTFSEALHVLAEGNTLIDNFGDNILIRDDELGFIDHNGDF
jgi:hypothetical protein